MGVDVHNNRITVCKGFNQTFEVQAFTDESKKNPLILTGGKAWYAVSLIDDIGTTRLFQFHSTDASPLVVITDAVNGKFEFTIRGVDTAGLDAPIELAWDAAVQTAAGDNFMAVKPSILYVDCVVNDPSLLP